MEGVQAEDDIVFWIKRVFLNRDGSETSQEVIDKWREENPV